MTVLLSGMDFTLQWTVTELMIALLSPMSLHASVNTYRAKNSLAVRAWRTELLTVLLSAMSLHASVNTHRANGPILLRQIMTGQETESEAVFFTIESIPYFKLSSFVSPNFDKPLLFPFDRGRTFVKGHFVVFRVWNSPERSAFLKFPDPWPWINNRLDRWYGQVFRLYGWYFRSNGLARKRETTHYNAAELI